MTDLNSLTLITAFGDPIEIHYPDNIVDEFIEDFSVAQSKNGWWHVGNWCDVEALYRGEPLEAINLNLVVGYR